MQSSDVRKKKRTKGESKGLSRGRPEGASEKKVTKETHSKQSTKASREVAAGAADDDEDEDPDPVAYWAAIHYKNADPSQASDVIRTLGEDGVYLVRDSSSDKKDEKVLVVYINNLPRKFKLERTGKMWCLQNRKADAFKSVEELMLHYYENPLPGYSVKLETPFMIHPMFKQNMLS